jgi:hypothetical protein
MVGYQQLSQHNQEERKILKSEIQQHCKTLAILADKLEDNYQKDFLQDNADMIRSYNKDLRNLLQKEVD